jgi:hypothetical protein
VRLLLRVTVTVLFPWVSGPGPQANPSVDLGLDPAAERPSIGEISPAVAVVAAALIHKEAFIVVRHSSPYRLLSAVCSRPSGLGELAPTLPVCGTAAGMILLLYVFKGLSYYL